MLLAVVAGLWLAAAVAGMGLLWEYSVTPGAAGDPPSGWPAASRIPHRPDSLTLIMAVHPQCPCSRASIGELSALMARTGGRLHAWVIFVRPPGFGDNWVKSDLWQSASAIPGVTSLVDDGREARLFGATTSGQTMVYDGGGRLLFTGGVTAARGHWGDNAGASAITALLNDPAPRANEKTPVYGCPLFGPNSLGVKGKMVCRK
jgi:hypothetical protein